MDREAAGTIAALFVNHEEADEEPETATLLARTERTAALANPLARSTKTPPQMISEGAFSLVAGLGFEPRTSGL
jgi:hypothetical protein